MAVVWIVLVMLGGALALFMTLFALEWLVEHRWRIRFVRASPWEPTPRAGCLTLLPGRVAGVHHRPREDDVCRCLAKGAMPDGVRLMLGVSPSVFQAWDRRGQAVSTTVLGRIRSIAMIQQAHGLLVLRGNDYSTDVDNMPIPTASRHRLRLTFADWSSAEITVRPYQNARRFVEVFNRIHDDPGLRLLGALRPGVTESPDALAEALVVSPDAVTRRLDTMTAAGLIRRSDAGILITEAGVRELSDQTRYIAEMSRIIVPSLPRDYFT